jgi:hypothetical protein
MNTKLIAVTVAALGAVPCSLLAVSNTIFDPGSITVHVEVVENKDGPNTSGVDLSIAGSKGCAEVARDTDHANLEVKVCREGGSAASPVLRFNVRSTAHCDCAVRNRSFNLTSRVGRGAPQVIGKVADASGASASILANLVK